MTVLSLLATHPQRPSAWSSSQGQCNANILGKDLSPSEHSLTQPSSPSPAPVFSPNSSPSSQSSLSDTGASLSQTYTSASASERSWSNQTQAFSGEIQSQACAETVRRTCSKPRGHPRRTQAPSTWIRPSLVRQDQRRQQLVEQLVDAATQLVALIWPESNSTKPFQNRVISLRFFIRETLRRSRTSYSTLQVTLWYLVLIRPHATQSFSESEGQGHADANFASDSCRPLQCGRRMFLSALILASKFLQDRNFTARAWSKITGLPTQDIISNEFLFLNKISWNLHLKEQDFARWNCIIIRCTESTQLGRNVRDTWLTVLDCIVEKGLNLQETAQLLAAQHRNPMTLKQEATSSLEGMCGNDSACFDASLATFNFPNHASPFSTAGAMGSSSSPLVAMETRVGGAAGFDPTGQLATPSSMASSLLAASPSRLEADLRAASVDPISRPSSALSRTFSYTDNCCGALTPASNASPTHPAEVRRMSSSAQEPARCSRCISTSEQLRMSGQAPFENFSDDQHLRHRSANATMRASQRQRTPCDGVARGAGDGRRPKLNAVDLYAAITQEYRRQKHQRLSVENSQTGQKRGLCEATDPRCSKLRCREDVATAPCLMTPVATQTADEQLSLR